MREQRSIGSIQSNSQKQKLQIHEILPVWAADSRILILGSFPSVKSRQAGFFYAHPQNRFWKVLSAIFLEPIPESVEEKKSLLFSHRIAVWDVIASCELTGSEDSSIQSVTANDIRALINNSSICKVFTNGSKAKTLYDQHIFGKQTELAADLLPSTSPANAAYSTERLTKIWREKLIEGMPMENAYVTCPTITTEHFKLRLIEESDGPSLFQCYHDRSAVAFMNDDNCDFGFYIETPEQMATTIKYWIDFYKKGYFIRFSIIDQVTGLAVGTVEGFGGDTGVLRVDINHDYEKEDLLSEIFVFARQNFYEIFGNKELVTKAVESATERRKALISCGWEFIDTFRTYSGYYKISIV